MDSIFDYDDIYLDSMNRQIKQNYHFCRDGTGVFWHQLLSIFGQKTAVWIDDKKIIWR